MNNRFVIFSPELECSCIHLPVVYGSDLNFEVDHLIDSIFICTLYGDTIKQAAANISEKNISVTTDLSALFALNDSFVLKYTFEDVDYYSNPFVYIGCDESESLLFSFSNESESYKIRLYALISSPQVKTDKIEYETMNGPVVALSKRRRKEFELEFYFYPESIHDSIQEMLCFPNLTVDEVPMFESGDYEIDWKGEDENGYARSTTKLSEQKIIKYSNC